MRWTLKPKPQAEKTKALQQALDIDANIATLLVQRGIETFEEAKWYDFSGFNVILFKNKTQFSLYLYSK